MNSRQEEMDFVVSVFILIGLAAMIGLAYGLVTLIKWVMA